MVTSQEGIGETLIRLALQPLYNGWELSTKGFDCFGYRRRALIALEKDLNRWEDDGGK